MIKRIFAFLFVFVGILSIFQIIFGVKRDYRNSNPHNTEVSYKRSPNNQSVDKITNMLEKFRNKLNTRQIEILKLYRKSVILLPSDIYSLHPNVSTRTLRRDMSSLVELGLVIQEGTTRDTRYLLRT
jgi:hypothetical protein